MNYNLLINGNFDLWQRGTTFSISSDDPYAEESSAPTVKAADRWYIIDTQIRGSGHTGSLVIYREPVNSSYISGNAKYAMTVVNQMSGLCGGFCYIENKQHDVKKYAGIPLSLSFYAKSINGVTGITLTCYYRQVTKPTSIENWSEIQTIVLQPQWNQFIVNFTPDLIGITSGITFDNNYFSIGFKLAPEKSITLTSVLLQELNDNLLYQYISDVKEERKRQNEYYYTTYPLGVTASSRTLTNDNDLSAIRFTVNPNYSFNYKFETPVRKNPTVTFYSPESGTQNDAYNKSASRDMRLTSGTRGWNSVTRFSPSGSKTLVASGNTYGVEFSVSTGAVVFDDILVHLIADADIDLYPKDRGLETL